MKPDRGQPAALHLAAEAAILAPLADLAALGYALGYMASRPEASALDALHVAGRDLEADGPLFAEAARRAEKELRRRIGHGPDTGRGRRHFADLLEEAKAAADAMHPSTPPPSKETSP